MALNRAQTETILKRLGFRVDTNARYAQAIRDFQAGWNLGTALKIDGVAGEKTDAALALSEKRRSQGKPTASAHFSFKEFQCQCGGRYSSCRRICGEGKGGSGRHVLRALLQSCEVLRTKFYPHGMSIVSGYRCDSHNKSVGGATSSQHRYGAAADISPVVSTNSVRNLDRFSGIGYQGNTGKVRHVDRRDKSGVNTTNGTVTRPTVWKY